MRIASTVSAGASTKTAQKFCGDRIRRFETFDVAAAEQALARFAEVCAERAREPAA